MKLWVSVDVTDEVSLRFGLDVTFADLHSHILPIARKCTHVMMIVPEAASKCQIPIRCNGQITDDDTRRARTSFEK